MKQQLRTEYQSKRKVLSEDQIEDLSLAIANNTLKLPIWDYTYYHIFLPIQHKKEVNTEYLLQVLQGKDKEVVLSKSDFDSHEMQNILLTDNTKIKINPYGIPEPIEGIEVPYKNIEVVFVPLLAFDQKGNRIGYGKGFYDRFLAQCQPNTIKVGLSLFEAEVQSFEFVEPTDIPLDYCITPIKAYQF